MNSRQKGARGEREWRDQLREAGYNAHRGQQFSGANGDPDVVCDDLPWIHFEVKRCKQLRLTEAMEQAKRDAKGKVPVVAHKRDREDWMVTLPAEEFWPLLRGDHLDEQAAAAVTLGEDLTAGSCAPVACVLRDPGGEENSDSSSPSSTD